MFLLFRKLDYFLIFEISVFTDFSSENHDWGFTVKVNSNIILSKVLAVDGIISDGRTLFTPRHFLRAS